MVGFAVFINAIAIILCSFVGWVTYETKSYILSFIMGVCVIVNLYYFINIMTHL
jgi:hypothetical protein